MTICSPTFDRISKHMKIYFKKTDILIITHSIISLNIWHDCVQKNSVSSMLHL